MSYEVHLTRAELPWESAEQPIDLSEWLAYAGARPDLRVNGRIGWADGTEIPVYEYRCAAGYPVSLTWGDGAVAVKGLADEDGARELLPLAAGLRANLVGDDGERYTADGVVWPD